MLRRLAQLLAFRRARRRERCIKGICYNGVRVIFIVVLGLVGVDVLMVTVPECHSSRCSSRCQTKQSTWDTKCVVLLQNDLDALCIQCMPTALRLLCHAICPRIKCLQHQRPFVRRLRQPSHRRPAAIRHHRSHLRLSDLEHLQLRDGARHARTLCALLVAAWQCRGVCQWRQQLLALRQHRITAAHHFGRSGPSHQRSTAALILFIVFQ